MDIFWHAISFKKKLLPQNPFSRSCKIGSLKYSHRPTKRRRWSPEHKGPKPKTGRSAGPAATAGRRLSGRGASHGRPGWSWAALWWARQAASIGPRGHPAHQRAQGRAQGLCGQNWPVLENIWWFNWACWPTCKRSRRKWEDEGPWCSELAEIYSKIEDQ